MLSTDSNEFCRIELWCFSPLIVLEILSFLPKLPYMIYKINNNERLKKNDILSHCPRKEHRYVSTSNMKQFGR